MTEPPAAIVSTPALRQRLLDHADEIKAWREDDSQGAGDALPLACDAEPLLRAAASALASPQEYDDALRASAPSDGAERQDLRASNDKAPSVLGLEQLLADYRAAEDSERGLDWYWCDQIEDRIGRERYRQIMFGAKPDDDGREAQDNTPSKGPFAP